MIAQIILNTSRGLSEHLQLRWIKNGYQSLYESAYVETVYHSVCELHTALHDRQPVSSSSLNLFLPMREPCDCQLWFPEGTRMVSTPELSRHVEFLPAWVLEGGLCKSAWHGYTSDWKNDCMNESWGMIHPPFVTLCLLLNVTENPVFKSFLTQESESLIKFQEPKIIFNCLNS